MEFLLIDCLHYNVKVFPDFFVTAATTLDFSVHCSSSPTKLVEPLVSFRQNFWVTSRSGDLITMDGWIGPWQATRAWLGRMKNQLFKRRICAKLAFLAILYVATTALNLSAPPKKGKKGNPKLACWPHSLRINRNRRWSSRVLLRENLVTRDIGIFMEAENLRPRRQRELPDVCQISTHITCFRDFKYAGVAKLVTCRLANLAMTQHHYSTSSQPRYCNLQRQNASQISPGAWNESIPAGCYESIRVKIHEMCRWS